MSVESDKMNSKDKKILILGAAGKTGNATALQLLKKGFQVRENFQHLGH